MTGWILIFHFLSGSTGNAVFADRPACLEAAANMRATFGAKVIDAICVPQSSILPK